MCLKNIKRLIFLVLKWAGMWFVFLPALPCCGL